MDIDKCKNKKIGPTIIPYSSDGAKEFLFGQINGVNQTTVSISVGFGDSREILTQSTQPIDFINGAGENGITAFPLPRSGCLESLSVSATITDVSDIPEETIITLTAQLFKAKCDSSIFIPIPETQIILAPSITSTSLIGTVFNGSIKKINYPLNKLDHLALLFIASISTPVEDGFFFEANISGGITIV